MVKSAHIPIPSRLVQLSRANTVNLADVASFTRRLGSPAEVSMKGGGPPIILDSREEDRLAEAFRSIA